MGQSAKSLEVEPPRTAKGAMTRRRLMEAAARLFAQRGYDSTSVEAIATEAGITVPGMYRHFPSKATVLMEVARAANDASTARRALAPGPDLPERLRALFAEYTAPDEVERRRLSIELSRTAFQNEDFQGSLADYNAALRRQLRQTLTTATPGLGEDEAEMLTHLLLVLLMGAVHIDTLDPAMAGDEGFLEFLGARINAMLAASGAGAGAGGTEQHHGSPTGVELTPSRQPPEKREAWEEREAAGSPSVTDEPADGRRRRGARTRRRILDVAAELFALHGYDATRTDDIAAAAGITVPALYLHFSSKEELLDTVGRQAFAEYRLSAVAHNDRDVLTGLADLVCSFSGPRDNVARRLAIELDFGAWRSPALAAALVDFHHRARRKMADALSPCITTPEHREHAAMAVLMLWMGTAHLDTVDPELVGNDVWGEFLHRRLPQLVGAE